MLQSYSMIGTFKECRAAGKPLATLLRENRVWGPRERLIGPALSRVTDEALEKALSSRFWLISRKAHCRAFTGSVLIPMP